MTREEWLQEGIKELKPIFEEKGYELPETKVSIGFTGGSKKAIGTCWRAEASSNNIAQIFIHPSIDDSTRVLDILAHELIHAIFPDAGHKGMFRTCAIDIGLTGKMTATIASPELKAKLETIVSIIGDIPHGKLKSNSIGAKKKQTTRMIKLTCNTCDYIVRTSRTNAEKGLPTCFCGGEFEISE